MESASNMPAERVGGDQQGRQSRRFPWSRFATGLVVIGALMGFGWSWTQNHADDPHELPTAVESVDPAPGSPVVPSQSTVTADLQFGYEATLSIDGREIPLDQLSFVKAQNIVSFTPGEGKEFRRFGGGPHTATVVYWPVNGTQERDAKEFPWHFSVN